MDEVDKIITHTLHQIDECIEPNVGLSHFTPELVVHAVASCLHEINPNQMLPRTLPVAMAQRFTVATTLAEACLTAGYRSDIGYQTFLYPSAVELRRLFMFLIEQMPRENTINVIERQRQLSEFEQLQYEMREKLQQQLRAPWVPQYCRAVGNRRKLGCSSLSTKFAPQLNLNIPGIGERTKEVQQYLEQQAPNVFQQTSTAEYDLISTVLHNNDLDRFGMQMPADTITVTAAISETPTLLICSNVSQTDANNEQQTDSESTVPPLEQLQKCVEELRTQCDVLMTARKALNASIGSLRTQLTQTETEIDKLRPILKIHERTCLVLEEPTENVSKLETLIENSKVKRQTLEKQWQEYREPLLDNLKAQKSAKQAKNIQSVVELRDCIDKLTQELREKTTLHTQLNTTLQSTAQTVAPRKEYTHRIHEFIGNIRKQRTDIFKVLDDTRDLQKQLNLVSAQLQRQFNYTDDLLFQSAKHDLHAKKAYKLLATVHENCSELVEYVLLTGNVSKEIRDLEVQIDDEKMKNIAMSLTQISADIQKFEQHIKELQHEIRTVENEITSA